MKNFDSKNNRGFTVLETIIAITIIAAVIGGVSLAVKTNINALTNSKEEVKAFYLAQEAVEMIRNRRDSNQLDVLYGGTSTWLTGYAEQASDPCYFGNTCRVDASLAPTNSNAFVVCVNNLTWGQCPVLNQNSSTYVNGYTATSGWNPTIYKREVQLERIVIPGYSDQISITVQISWTHAGVPKSFKTKTLLTNWF